MANAFYLLCLIGGLIGARNWKHGLVIAMILDCARDPVRKLVPGEPTTITYAVGLVWAGLMLNMLVSQRKRLMEIRQRFLWIDQVVILLLCSLVPGALMSLSLHKFGPVLALVGFVSYSVPLLGILVGICYTFDLAAFRRLLQVYIFVNSLFFIGSLAELLNWGWPGLGGLSGFHWIRYTSNDIVTLYSGFFRSPDIAGFHAANVMIASIMLLLNRGDKPRLERRMNPVWLFTASWSFVPLLLCGRRKMLVIPVVFVVTYLCYLNLFSRRDVRRVAAYIASVVAIGAVPLILLGNRSTVDSHQAYYASTLSDLAPRLRDNVAGSVVGTLQQSGVMGGGLGVATQGAHYFSSDQALNAWQEDGVSRLFMELGIPGVIMIGLAGIILIRRLGAEARKGGYAPLVELRAMMFAMSAGNLASFVASHQHFSSDPANTLWVLIFFGMFMGALAINLPANFNSAATAQPSQVPPPAMRPVGHFPGDAALSTGQPVGRAIE
ncbi:MAG: hypothetical protein CBB71_22845 [Rhodopirellula sp. TMED11]|nr:MAG: hypothetical protein CBB71_22845 [Rhodopirellula sp. TMED11]